MKLIKKFCLIIIILGISFTLTFPFLSPLTKIALFTFIEKPFYRIRPSKPNSQVDKDKLDAKIARGLPSWAEKQINEDLSSFSTITEKELDNFFAENNTEHNRLIRIKIKEGTVQILTENKDLANSIPFKIIQTVMQYLAKNQYVKNTDFILSLQDYVIPAAKSAIPIFTFSKDTTIPIEKNLILVPDWQNLRSRAELKPRIDYANTLFPTASKKPLLFWRGSTADSTGFRKVLVLMTAQYPNQIDAEFSQLDPSKYVSEDRHIQYRYQITIDGARATWERLVWQLQSNCLVFKQKSNHIQWFYKGITPGVHYVSINDQTSLLKALDWANKNPEKEKQIIQAANLFAEQNLDLEDMYHYYIALLNRYSAITAIDNRTKTR